MKSSVLIFAILSFFTINVFASVDTVKVNKVVAEILNEIAAKDSFVDRLEIILDQERTDVDKPSIGVSILGETRQAAWSKETTSLSATLLLDSLPTKEEGVVTVVGSLTGELDTDVYSLGKFVAKNDLCEVFVFNPNQGLETCKALEDEVLNAESFQDQVQAVSKAFDNFQVELKNYVLELERKLEAETDQEEKRVLIYEIGSAKDLIKTFEAIVFKTDDSGISVEADLSEEPYLSGLNLILKVNVSKDSLKLVLDAKFEIEEERLKSYYSLPIEIIRILESDSADSKEYIKSFGEFYVDFLKNIVTED